MRNKILTATYIMWASVFIILPMALIVVYGFTVEEGGKLVFSLDNFVRFFTGEEYLIPLWRSLYLAFFCTLICLVLGYPMAMILAKSKSKYQNFMVTLFVLPMWMNFLLRTYAWLTILETNGLINSLLAAMGLPKAELLYNQGAVLLGMVYNYLPFMVFPIYSSLAKTDKSLVEAAGDLGATKAQTFRKVTFPLSLPGVISGINMVFMPAVTTFVISRLMGGGHTSLIGDIIEQQFMYANNRNFGSAISVVIMVIIVISIGVMSKYEDEEEAKGGLW